MTHEEFINEYLQNSMWINENNDKWIIKGGILFIRDNLDFTRLEFADLRHITELPDNLHIKGWLDTQKTKITSFPENLYIGNMLFINDSWVYELPDSIAFGLPLGSDYILNTKVKASEKLQLKLISQDSRFIKYFKKPTKKAKALHGLLWEL